MITVRRNVVWGHFGTPKSGKPREMVRTVQLSALLVMGGLVACGRIDFGHLAAPQPDGAPACTGDFLVDSAADDPDRALACDGAGCSLRAAIALANASPTRATICFGDALSIALATSLVVTGDVTLLGASTSICGTGTDRVFDVAAGGTLHLRDLTVCHGRLTDGAGAAVQVQPGAGLDADRVVFDDHLVTSDIVGLKGGAIRADGSVVLEIRHSRFTNNRVEVSPANTGFARGGAIGIQSDGTTPQVVIEDTAFEDNAARDVGGALYLALDGANITLERLLFARNSSNTGSAIDLNCASTGTFVIDNSTFANNMAPGGMIYECDAQTVRLSFCSFAGNNNQLVLFGTAAGRVEWHANAIQAGAFEVCFGPGTNVSLDANIVDRNDASCPLTGANDRFFDPMLGPLANNGGLTATLALRPGSPAIDAAGTLCPPVDQRGMPRPAGGACDAGAFELQ